MTTTVQSPQSVLADPTWTILTFPFFPNAITGRVRLETVFALLRTRGVAGVDMFDMEIGLYGEKRVRRALQANGLILSTLITGVSFLASSDVIEKKVRKALALAKRYGATRLMIVPTDAMIAKRQWKLISEAVKFEHYVRGFTLAVELAAAERIEVLLEDTPTIDASLASAVDCRALLDRVPGLGFVFDTGNMLVAGDDPLEFYEAVKDRVRCVHFKDVRLRATGPGDTTHDGRRMSPTVRGGGVVPLREIFERLQADGNASPIAIEYVRPTGGSGLAAHTAQLDRFVAAAADMRRPRAASVESLQARPFRWAYIGTGSIARTTSRKILATERHEIATTYSRTDATNAAFAEKVGARAARSLEDAVADPAVEGVYIASPANSHADLARQCIALGKPILLEKPFTVNEADAREIIDLARENRVYLVEAMWTWFSPVSRRVKAWVDAGELGDVLDVRISIGFDMLRFYPRLKDPELVGGGLLDLGIYATTYAHNLFGVPDEIRATGTLTGGIDTEVELLFLYTNGPTVRIRNSVTKWLGERIVITGTKGKIDLPFFHFSGAATLTPATGRKRRFRGLAGFDNQFDLVAQEIRAGRTESALVPHRTTLENLAILDECRRQIGLRFPFESGIGTTAARAADGAVTSAGTSGR